MGEVNVTYGNGNLGNAVATNDNIIAAIMHGASNGDIVAGTPFLVNTLQDAVDAGLAVDTNPLAYKHVTEFYAELALQGVTSCQLAIMLVPTTMLIHQMVDITNASGAVKLLNYMQGAVKFLFAVSNDGAAYGGSPLPTLVQTHSINEDCLTALNKAHALGQAYAGVNTPLRVLIGGTSYNGTAASLTALTTMTYNRACAIVGDTVSGAGAAVGLVGGRKAALPVQRKISRVKDGALSATTAFVGTANAAGNTSLAVIAGKGYITFQQYPELSGFYFSGDPMAVATTDDYDMLARGLVADKMHRIAYATFIQEVDDEIPTVAGGGIDPKYAKWLQQKIINQLNLGMVAKGELAAADCYIDPAQNVISTNTLNIVVKGRPVGYATDIEINLGFEL